jgi:hypothetical protein
MSEDFMFRVEEQLECVAPLPVLSRGLRTRVLAAAAEAQARRSQGRRALAGGAVLFSLLAWIAWTGPILPSARQVAGTEAALEDESLGIGASGGASPARPAPASSGPFSRRETFIAAMGDDWRMVEAEFKSREEFTRRVQM